MERNDVLFKFNIVIPLLLTGFLNLIFNFIIIGYLEFYVFISHNQSCHKMFGLYGINNEYNFLLIYLFGVFSFISFIERIIKIIYLFVGKFKYYRQNYKNLYYNIHTIF